MKTSKTQTPGRLAVDITISESHGWGCYRSNDVDLWFKGWVDGLDGNRLAARLAACSSEASKATINGLIAGLKGHFALVATGSAWAIAAVDHVRSIPLATVWLGERWMIGDRPDWLRREAGLDVSSVNPEAALTIGMAGYTIGGSALYRGLDVLCPGEMVFIDGNGFLQKNCYYFYRPWQAHQDAPARKTAASLADTTLKIIDKTLKSLDGRPLVVPLSAGNDSRLIVSAAKHLGYRDVRCFTYGRTGNFEVETSRAIAERLGYPWRFVPSTVSKLRRYFTGESYAAYLDYADCCTAVPFVQDMWPIEILKSEGFIPLEAVFANGNTGDYISGLHIVPSMRTPRDDLDEVVRWQRVLDALYDKHFALWQSLRNDSNRKTIKKALIRSMQQVGASLGSPEMDYGLYEGSEFLDRQCKYVITGQKIYEFLGHEWRLPLWDRDYLDFWEGVPLEDKVGQSLYTQMLQSENWGKVWHDIPVNRPNIRPQILVPLRWLAKAAHAPLGRARWHVFERRFFQYWMDMTCNTACVPYGSAALDTRGARHSVSWLAEQYLARHGVSLDEFPSS